MSTPKNPWKAVAIGFIILTVAFGAISAAALYEATRLSSDKQNLTSQVSDLTTKLASKDSTIASLNGQLNTANAQIASDKAQIAYLQTQLNGNVTLVKELQAKLLALEASNIGIIVVATQTPSNPPSGCFFGICIFPGNPGLGTIRAVAWANFGVDDAIKVTFTATFYAANGNQLCSTPAIELGMMGTVPGDTIKGFPSLTDSCGWPEPMAGGMGVAATSVTGTVTWTDSVTGLPGSATVAGTILS